MAFPSTVKEKALVACGRHCCICHHFAGLKLELHHIKQKSEGGSDDFENCIPLCFDCHADMRSYDHNHPKGTKYTENELIKHRDNWYGRAHQVVIFAYSNESAKLDKAVLDDLKKILTWRGSIKFARENNFAGFAFRRSSLDELRDFEEKCEDPDFEFIDSELESLRADLESAVIRFMNVVAKNTFVLDHNIEFSTVPPEWEINDPVRFWQVIDDMHDAARSLVAAYDCLVRAGRRKLGLIGENSN